MKLNSQVPIEERWKADAGFSILPPEENADGGPGSGNYCHEGVPGKVGGSAPSKSENHTLSEVSDKIPSSALHPEYVYGYKIFGGVVDEDVGTEARKAFKSSSAPPARKTFKLSDLKTDQIVNRTSDIRKMIELCPSYNDVVALSSKDPIKVVRHKGNNILIDGNTRASVAKIYGMNEIPVDFYDLDSGTEHGDGGPGSGNFSHEGRPGEIGGSAPKGSADCAASVQKLSTLKDGFSNLTAKQQYVYLSRSGVIPNSELETLKAGATSGDPEAIKTLKQYEEDYFYNAEYGRTVKSLDCEMRDEVASMSKEEARNWISQSTSRELYDYEQWANPNSDAQKVAIDLGMVETPQVVSKDDFNKYVEESGAVVCYRGVKSTPDMSGASMLYQMAYNTQENYFGDGIYGDGLYFSTDQNTAVAYANGSEAVAMCAIRPDAKVIDYKSPEIEKARKDLGTSDYAVAAMCSGYDAIKVKMGGDEDYYVVLNRAAMIMADPVDVLANTAIKASQRNSVKNAKS